MCKSRDEQLAHDAQRCVHARKRTRADVIAFLFPRFDTFSVKQLRLVDDYVTELLACYLGAH